MDEGKAVAAAAGVELHEDPWEMNVRRSAGRDRGRRGRLRARPVDARGRPRGPADRGRLHHRRARPRGRRAGVAGAAARGACPGWSRRARERHEGRVIGCGAVGSLFAANLAPSTTSRSGPTTCGRRTSTRSTRTGCGSRAPARSSGASGRRRPGRAAAPATSGSWRRSAMHTSEAMAATAHAFADGAVCSVQNGAGNEELDRRARRPGDPRDDVPGRTRDRARARRWDTKGDTHIGPFEPSPAPMNA